MTTDRNHTEHGAQPMFRHGAFAAEMPHLDPDNLPLVVWLRGDEPFFSTFSLSADEAMAILGIRRSRLTQISGRELRVGRTRIERYVRPVFRPEDVHAYAAWTRQTASHQKSADMLKEAALILSNKSEKLTEELMQKSTGIDPEIIDQFLSAQRQGNAQFQASAEQLLIAQGQLKLDILQTVDDRYRRLAQSLTAIATITDGQGRADVRLNALSNLVVQLMTDLQEQSLAASRAQSQLLATVQAQSQSLATMEATIGNLTNLMQTTLTSKKKRLRRLQRRRLVPAHDQTAASAVVPRPKRRPRMGTWKAHRRTQRHVSGPEQYF